MFTVVLMLRPLAGLPDDFKEKKPNLQEIKPKIKPNQKLVTFAKKTTDFNENWTKISDYYKTC